MLNTSSLESSARDLAKTNLEVALPRRWQHVQSVASEAARIAAAFGDDGPTLVAAAWLHDIGYNPEIAKTGFHPIDGAEYLRDAGWPARICALVAHHSFAACEADLREMQAGLNPFPDEETPLRDALWYCDLTTGPSGQRLSVEARLAEIVERYGSEHVVSKFVENARDDLVAAVNRTIVRLRSGGID